MTNIWYTVARDHRLHNSPCCSTLGCNFLQKWIVPVGSLEVQSSHLEPLQIARGHGSFLNWNWKSISLFRNLQDTFFSFIVYFISECIIANGFPCTISMLECNTAWSFISSKTFLVFDWKCLGWISLGSSFLKCVTVLRHSCSHLLSSWEVFGPSFSHMLSPLLHILLHLGLCSECVAVFDHSFQIS